MNRVDRPLLELVVPVLDEERVLRRSIERLRAFALEELADHRFRITIVDNGSTDRTGSIARELAERHPDVQWLRLDRAGRGGALREAWSRSDADVLAYSDVDLSSDLAALPVMLARLRSGGGVAIGSRHAAGSSVSRSLHRAVLSRGYNLIVGGLFGVRFRDAQCGLKAITCEAAAELLPLVVDDGWFFDTELLLLAERLDLPVHEVGLRWVEDPDSRVRVISTALADLRGLARLRFGGLDRAVRRARRLRCRRPTPD